MCTVSYLPLKKGGFLLSSNRDEAPDRNALEIARREIHGQQVLFPKDPAAGGTWFLVADSGRACCLLNGAYIRKPHIVRSDRSRGNVPLDVLGYPGTDTFVETYDFEGYPDFTLVVCDGEQICQVKWDGTTPELKLLNPGIPHIWSSVTLYPQPVREKREVLFREWLDRQSGDFSQDAIIDFHRFGGYGDKENDFVMNRNEIVKTVSISSVKLDDTRARMIHKDLVNDSVEMFEMPVKSAPPLARQA